MDGISSLYSEWLVLQFLLGPHIEKAVIDRGWIIFSRINIVFNKALLLFFLYL